VSDERSPHERRDERPTDGPAEPPDDAERRRRRARVFGEVLPEGTRDDRADYADREPTAEGTDDWLRRQVPPHHG